MTEEERRRKNKLYAFIGAESLRQGGGSATLAGLADVDITDLLNGQILVYDETNEVWVNATPTGGTITIDTALSDSSTNPVQNKVIKAALDLKQDKSNLVTSISSSSTDAQYPSAKLLYDTVGDIETLLAAI